MYNGWMRTLEERFWAKVHRAGPDECWTWIGALRPAPDNYGFMQRPGQPGKWYVAHRLSWEIHFGSIPTGLVVCHRCDNPPCVNPAHLFVGTRGDNAADRGQKRRGREARQDGSANPNVKLSEADVCRIRELAAAGVTQVKIAERFGIKQPHVSRIVRGENWRTVALR